MNYSKHYNHLIEIARNRLLEGYTERHHVLPRCMGGNDDPENIVILTAREHYIAHQLLVKIHPKIDGLIHAAKAMTFDKHGNRVNNRLYEWLRQRHADAVSRNLKGKPQSTEHKRKRSEALKGSKNPNYGKLSPVKGRTFNEIYGSKRAYEMKMKIVFKMEEQWKIIEKTSCPYCKTTGRGPIMKRWHFDNCKENIA